MKSTAAPLVLVVDDDAGVARLIEKRLLREKIDVLSARSGAAALELLATRQPRLMLLDLKLEDMSGATVIERLAGQHRSLPFVVITGQGDERAAVEMMKRGARDYLVKDAHFLDFVPAVVRRVLEELALEERLGQAENQARLGQAVLEQGYSAVLVVTADAAGPTVVYANRAFAELTGQDAGAVAGQTLAELENRIGPLPELQRVLDTGQPFSGERLVRRRGDEERVVDCHIAPVADGDGRIGHWVVIQRDVTERQRLEREVSEISFREQRRIGQDLHDGLGQHLTAIELMCEALRCDLATERPAVAEQAGLICRFLREAIAQTRALARGLAPFRLKAGGLQTALEELAEMTSAAGLLKCRMEAVEVLPLGDEEAVQLYRIAQEAVNNAVKHSRASEIVLRLAPAPEGVRLEVSDNGSGLSRARGQRGGMGLDVMKHRSSSIGAALEVRSTRKGTKVICTLPHRK